MEMNIDLLKEILSVQSTSGYTTLMVNFILKWLKDEGIEVEVNNGNVYATKGRADLYPTYVSHTDTVHQLISDLQIKERGKANQRFLYGMNGQSGRAAGCGGDDKVGIFACLTMLKYLPAAKAAFFRDEEIGCVGSRVAKMSFFDDSSFVGQTDRRGGYDIVNVISGIELYGEEFSKSVSPIAKEHEFKETPGGMTDVMQLKENGLGVACFNMSSGYYSPHTPNEYVSINDVSYVLSFLYEVGKKLGHKKWEHKHKSPLSRNLYSSSRYAHLDRYDWEHALAGKTQDEEYQEYEDANVPTEAEECTICLRKLDEITHCFSCGYRAPEDPLDKLIQLYEEEDKDLLFYDTAFDYRGETLYIELLSGGDKRSEADMATGWVFRSPEDVDQAITVEYYGSLRSNIPREEIAEILESMKDRMGYNFELLVAVEIIKKEKT